MSKVLITNKGNSKKTNKSELQRRSLYWRNVYKKRTSGSNELSKIQKEEIVTYYEKYAKEIGVDTVFHKFYLDKTGKWDLFYMPVDFYYCYIDPYYNDWTMASYIVNKTMFGPLFNNIIPRSHYFE